MWPRLDVVRDAGLLKLVQGPFTVGPGVTLLTAPGESPGHYVVRVESEGEVFYHLGDLVHYWFEFEHMEWIISEDEGRDLDAMVATRRKLLPRVASENAIATFSHADFPGWGELIQHGDRFRWIPKA